MSGEFRAWLKAEIDARIRELVLDRVPAGERCVRCGCPLDCSTPGCRACYDRTPAQRKRRNAGARRRLDDPSYRLATRERKNAAMRELRRRRRLEAVA